MVDHGDTASAILTAVADRFGIRFSEVHTGGGCMALEARLESGHWIVATDENLMGFRERIGWEHCHPVDDPGPRYGAPGAMGWFVGIYADDDGSWMGGQDSLVEAADYDASAGDLPDVVGRALAEFVRARSG